MSNAYTRFTTPQDTALLPIDHQPQMVVVDLLQPHSIFGAVQIPHGKWALGDGAADAG